MKPTANKGKDQKVADDKNKSAKGKKGKGKNEPEEE